jgi:hypothetical protein
VAVVLTPEDADRSDAVEILAGETTFTLAEAVAGSALANAIVVIASKHTTNNVVKHSLTLFLDFIFSNLIQDSYAKDYFRKSVKTSEKTVPKKKILFQQGEKQI